MEDFSRLLARVTVGASSIAGATKAVLVNVSGLLLGDEAEKANGVPLYGGLGLLGRPKALDADGTGAKGLAARIGDSLLPFALVDVRISKARGTLADGAISLAGYLGQHLTVEDGTGGGAKITLAIAGGSLAIVLDSSPGVARNIITGETRVTGTAGGDAAAVPVLIQPAATTIDALVTSVNAIAAVLNHVGPVVGAAGLVPLVTPLVGGTSSALKATPG